MSKIWFISDTHFDHSNVIKYCRSDRWEPEQAEQMNKDIIKNWNSVVGKEDIVYHLGDFAFSGSKRWIELVSQLNGKIEIVLGNHDKGKKKSQKWFLDKGFTKVHWYPIIVDNFWILSHEPIEFLSDAMPYVNIHGHLHERKFENKQYVNVSCEQINYTPILFDEIKSMFVKEDS